MSPGRPFFFSCIELTSRSRIRGTWGVNTCMASGMLPLAEAHNTWRYRTLLVIQTQSGWTFHSQSFVQPSLLIWDLAPVKHNWLWSWRSSEHSVSLVQLSKMDPFWKILHLWSSLSFPCPVLRFIPSISVHYELALTSYYRADPDTHRSSSKNRKWQTLWTNHFESSFSSCPAPARNKSRSPPTINAHAYHQLPLKLRKQIW